MAKEAQALAGIEGFDSEATARREKAKELRDEARDLQAGRYYGKAESGN